MEVFQSHSTAFSDLVTTCTELGSSFRDAIARGTCDAQPTKCGTASIVYGQRLQFAQMDLRGMAASATRIGMPSSRNAGARTKSAPSQTPLKESFSMSTSQTSSFNSGLKIASKPSMTLSVTS
ncbi:hypothetical protein SUGI_0172420 [Cryptomeria japonica]|nr:hypothetical protein SUGI_0172420 [Cryptomeria japonica]